MTSADAPRLGSASNPRHILSLSGGKDSTALAIHMKGRVSNMEYAFCDTGEELKETKEYIDKLEAYLGVTIHRLNPDRPFWHYLQVYRGVLPDARTRWCTRMLKIRPFEKYVGDDHVVSYVGIRADELHRKGYITSKPNITPKYPFIDDGVRLADVQRIIEESGLGLPEYYEWRSRSGCYFCFFQQRYEWVGLLERHPELFERAAAFEKYDAVTGERFTWVQNESLGELAKPERIAEIKTQYAERLLRQADCAPKNASLQDVFDADSKGDNACLVCHL